MDELAEDAGRRARLIPPLTPHTLTEPFSFGGLFGSLSKYGSMVDITGEGCLEFCTNRRKITSKWAFPAPPPIGGANGGNGGAAVDRASFVGSM